MTDKPTIIVPPATPPRLFERNQHGLIADGSVNYIFNEDGTINWRKMIRPEFLVPNKQVFDRRNKPVPETTDGLSDAELLILLGGIKELAQARGYHAVTYKVTSPSPDYVVAVCEIEWIGNYETGGRNVIFSAIGDASPNNTTSFGKLFLGPFAENRAFVRAVRNFLKVNIVGQEELSPTAPKEEDTGTALLQEVMNKFGLTFDKIKARMIEEKVPGAENFQSVGDIPRYKQFEYIERIKTRAAQAGKG